MLYNTYDMETVNDYELKGAQMRGLMKRMKLIAAIPAAFLLSTSVALASTGGGGSLPWDNVFTTFAQDLSGPVAHSIAIIMIVVCGLGYAFSDHSRAMQNTVKVLVGLSIAFGFATLAATFGFSSGAVIGGPQFTLSTIAEVVAGFTGGVAVQRHFFKRSAAPTTSTSQL